VIESKPIEWKNTLAHLRPLCLAWHHPRRACQWRCSASDHCAGKPRACLCHPDRRGKGWLQSTPSSILVRRHCW